MNRTAVLLMLLAAYLAVVVHLAGGAGADRRFDALSPQSRSVEQAIEARQFADALPLALEIQRAHADEPLIAYWLATIFRGLDRPRDEVAAWETYIQLSSAPAEACPALADAYERMGDHAGSIVQYQRCVDYDPREPERLVDLAEALERAQSVEQALDAFRAAALLDPRNMMLARRIDDLSRRTDGAH